MSIEKKLTDKEERFCQEYVKLLNATKAAIAAGYSEKTAKDIGCQNLAKLYIKARIDHWRMNVAELCELSMVKLVDELKAIAESSLFNFKKNWMELKEFEEVTERDKKAVSECHTEKINMENGEIKEIVRFKLHSKIQAIQELNKMLGYYAPKRTENKHTHDINKPEYFPDPLDDHKDADLPANDSPLED